MFRHTPTRILRLLIICQYVVWVAPISLVWIVGMFGSIYLPLVGWLKNDIELPRFYWLVGIPWMFTCGSGLWFLWDLFFRYREYAVAGVPMRLKAGILLGFIALLPIVIHEPLHTMGNSEPLWIKLLILYGIPACLLYQFHLLIAYGRRSKISVKRGA